MRRAHLSIALLVAAAATLQAQRMDPPDLNRRGAAVERLHVWIESLGRHDPGSVDDHARQVASWTSAELDDVQIDLQSLLRLIDAPGAGEFNVWVPTTRGEFLGRVVYTRSELDRLRRVALAVGGRDPRAVPTPDDNRRVIAANNRIVKLGALMHTDIALGHQRGDITPPTGARTARDDIIRFADGRQVGVERTVNQWRFARELLDLVKPRPSTDAAARAWYRASGAALLRDTQLHVDHFEAALRLFPDDAALLTLTASLHETLASPGVQVFVRTADLPPRLKLRVGSPGAELRQAESLFRRALAIDSGNVEARLRLGRVLSLQERHVDAFAELGRLESSTDALLEYHRSLFTGDAAQSLGRSNEARGAYERAAAQYPLAHAPQLALSQLAALAGEWDAALDALEAVVSADPDPSPGDDPFWSYHAAAGRDADALLVEAYRALAAETVP